MSVSYQDVWLENSAITMPQQNGILDGAERFMKDTVQTAVSALGDDLDVDLLAVTSQTGHSMYDLVGAQVRDGLKAAGVHPDGMMQERSFSNSQPLVQAVAERVEGSGLRALFVAMEPLNLFPHDERTSRITDGVLTAPERAHIPSMMHGLNDLLRAFCSHFEINPTAFAELKKQLATALHARKARNPLAQYRSVLTPEA